MKEKNERWRIRRRVSTIVVFAVLLAYYSQTIMAVESDDVQNEKSIIESYSGHVSENEGDDSFPDDEEQSVSDVSSAAPAQTVTVDTELEDEELIAVEMPIIDEKFMLDFYIDPQSMIYRTRHIPDGEHEVEEGAHLLFHNWEREGYAYSHNSDILTVTNRSTVPVCVTITAKIENFGNIVLEKDADFTDSDECAIYLAVRDDEGNEQPLTGKGEVSLTVELDKAPDGAYAYEYDEESGECRYTYLQNEDNMPFDSYSFWLTGDSNADALWENMSGRPKVTVIWHIEPVMPEGIEEAVETEKIDENREEQTSEDADEELTKEPDTEEEMQTTESDSEETIPDNTQKTDETEEPAVDGNDDEQDNGELAGDSKVDSNNDESIATREHTDFGSGTVTN